MSTPSARQQVFEVVNGVPVFTRPCYLFLTGQLQSGDDADLRLDAIDQAPIPIDNSAGLWSALQAFSQAPGVEELRSTVTEMQRQIDALTLGPK